MANQGAGARLGSSWLRDPAQLYTPGGAVVMSRWLLADVTDSEAAAMVRCREILGAQGGTSTVRRLFSAIRVEGWPALTLTRCAQLLRSHPDMPTERNGTVRLP